MPSPKVQSYADIVAEVRTAESAAQIWRTITDSGFYEYGDSDPAFLRETLEALIDKASWKETAQPALILGVGAHLLYECGVEFFRPLTPDHQREPDSEWVPSPSSFWSLLRARDPPVRSVAAIILGSTAKITEADFRILNGLTDDERDATTFGAIVLALAKWQLLLGLGDETREVLLQHSRLLLANSKPLPRSLGAAAEALTRAQLPSGAAHLLLDNLRNPVALPHEWGMWTQSESPTTAEISLQVLEWARVERPAKFALQVLAYRNSERAQRVAFFMTFLTPSSTRPYGPTLWEMTDDEILVMKKTAKVPWGAYLPLGIGRFDVYDFLGARGFYYRPFEVPVQESGWKGHFSSLVRRVALGHIRTDVAAAAFVNQSTPNELISALLHGLHLIAPLHRSRLEHERIEELIRKTLTMLGTKHKSMREILTKQLDRAHPHNSISAHIVVALEVYVTLYGDLPSAYEEHLNRALKDPASSNACRRLLRNLSTDRCEELILQHRATSFADVCLTKPVLEYLLHHVDENNAEEVLDVLLRGTSETRQLLSEIPVNSPIAEATKDLALELLEGSGVNRE